jgi:hypothetical protein
MLGVPLDEAVGLRLRGEISKAHESIRVSHGVCVRFTQSLELVLNGLRRHAKHFGIVPNAAPLDPANFLGSREQRTARITGFLNRVLLSQRSQFIHKAATLEEMVGDLRTEFCRAVDDLVDGLHVSNDALWDALIQQYTDLNTCLGETEILLKSFLVVLPEEQLDQFESDLELPSVRTASPSFAFRHGRFATVPGK